MTQEDAREIEAVIRELRERGEYESVRDEGPDPEGDRVLKAWALGEELTDGDVEWLAASVPETPVPPQAQLEREVAQVLGRAETEAAASPLARARMQRGLSRQDLADALLPKLGLDASKRGKLRRYYRALEAGVFETGQLSKRLVLALSDLLPAGEDELLGPAAIGAMGVTAPPAAWLVEAEEATEGVLPLPEAAAPEWDEIDELFRGG